MWEVTIYLYEDTAILTAPGEDPRQVNFHIVKPENNCLMFWDEKGNHVAWIPLVNVSIVNFCKQE